MSKVFYTLLILTNFKYSPKDSMFHNYPDTLIIGVFKDKQDAAEYIRISNYFNSTSGVHFTLDSASVSLKDTINHH